MAKNEITLEKIGFFALFGPHIQVEVHVEVECMEWIAKEIFFEIKKCLYLWNALR